MKQFYWKSQDNILTITSILSNDVQIDADLYKPDKNAVLISKIEFEELNKIKDNLNKENELLLSIRYKRDILLQQSDILYIRALESKLTAAKISPLKEYRQALRDITDQPDLENIVWPTLPDLDF